MKEFEKWYKNNHKDVWLSRSTKKVAAEDGWKTALEWVLSLPTLCDFSLDEETIYNELGIESPEAKHQREMRELND